MENNVNASAIISDASQEEEHSPFYIENKTICQEWEAFISQLNGSIKGSFSSWSIRLYADIPRQENWKVDIRKSSLSNTSLLIAPEKNVIEQTIFEVSDLYLGEFNIKIWESNIWNSLRQKVNPSINRLSEHLLIAKKGSPNQRGLEFIERIRQVPLEYKLASLAYMPAQKELKITFNSILRDYKWIESIVG